MLNHQLDHCLMLLQFVCEKTRISYHLCFFFNLVEATTYNNESCDLPYEYPQGDWMMHFCSRTSNTTDAAFICPTKTGFGICASGMKISF